ncbi:MAG TPA: CpsD/CapB family tyrosine-protein kinase [Chloroflexota bacterium]|nr:CpsD/CapB family tyrosine-protein kinase [Chloroflexota bacterium]
MATQMERTSQTPDLEAAPPALQLFAPHICRQIYAALGLSEAGTTVLGVTSTTRGEGRTILALSLAHILADDLEIPVCLVDADLTNPTVAEALGIAPAPGLCEVLRGEQALNAVRRQVGKVAVITAGEVGADAARLLLQMSRENPFHGPGAPAGLVIVDLPPLAGGSYGALAPRSADCLIMVVRAGMAPVRLIQSAVAQLRRPPAGIVFNAVHSALPWRRGE